VRDETAAVVAIAAARLNSGVQAGVVAAVTWISPGEVSRHLGPHVQ
jgi:hypothetical protein